MVAEIAEERTFPGPGAVRDPRADRDSAFRELLFGRDATERLEKGLNPAGALAETPVGPGLQISGVEPGSDDRHLAVRLNLDRDMTSLDTRNLLFMEHISGDRDPGSVRFFRLEGGDSLAAGEHEVNLAEADMALDSRTLATVGEILDRGRPGGLYMIDTEKGHLGFHWPIYTYVDVEVVVLQDGSRKRALILPVSGAGHQVLDPGRYTLRFEITRRRWTTTDTPDNWNTYNQDCSLRLDI